MINAILLAAAMMTPWGEKVTSDNCWREYPRPQLVRTNWTSLNGDWDYAVTCVTNNSARPAKWDGKIRVPYAVEAPLSGVGRLVEDNELIWYRRTIKCQPRAGERILLHFDGVDFRAMVFIGHTEVTDVPHSSGQEPFTLDVTDFVKPGDNELTVVVWDPTQYFVNTRGKQARNPGGCFYTRCSGIWQSVWMETVSETYIEDYNVVPDIDAGKVKFTFDTVGPARDDDVEVEIFDASGKLVAKGENDAQKGVEIKMPKGFELWSPEKPYLYTFKAKLEKDSITGYFGMRKFAKAKDAKGVLRFFLNNRPYFIIGTLDQGWWPDGLLTPPSEEAMIHDIMTLKNCGFNMMRKHIKVEPRRYYYLCDKLGILLLQDLPSNGSGATDYLRDGQLGAYGFQRYELKSMIDKLAKTPSIVMWVPYNEGWTQPGEFLTHATLDFVKRYDPSRLVNGPSGNNDFEGGQVLTLDYSWKNRINTKHRPEGVCEAADTVDMHLYRPDYPDGIHGHLQMLPVNDRRISFLGEFGGLGHAVEGHLYNPESASWGYGGMDDTKTREGLEKTYLKTMDDLVVLAAKGLGGSVYTQTTDVEGEINGLMTYDRKVLKFDAAKLKAAHDRIRAAADAAR